jgi:two-component system, cell cycle response regulator DivK
VDDSDQRISVLIVDDNADILAAYAEILRQRGLEVVTAADGATALEVAFRVHPDVILIDLWMPHMDGFETTRALKADPRTKGTPVAAFTSLGYTERKAESAGCDAFLRKGGDPEQLLLTIRKLVQGSNSK